MNPDTDPVSNHELHAKAERAAFEAFRTAPPGTQKIQTLMDKAARRVFKAAGTPADKASFYASCVTDLVLCRLHHQQGKN